MVHPHILHKVQVWFWVNLRASGLGMAEWLNNDSKTVNFELSLLGFCMFCCEKVCALECKCVFIDPVTSQALFSIKNCDGQENIEEGQLPLQASPLASHRQGLCST